MKKILFALWVGLCVSSVYADTCAVSSTTYSCYTGYYLSGTSCVRCPSSGGVYGTTVDQNTGGITSCYLPAGSSFSDNIGSGTYSADCYYSE